MTTSLTIIKGMRALANYEFATLPQDVLTLMQKCQHATNGSAPFGQLIKLFDAYCHITGAKVTYLTLSSSCFEDVVRGFLGALSSESFIDVTASYRKTYARRFVEILHEMAKCIPLTPTFAGKQGWPIHNEQYWEKAKKNLNEEAIRYWNGWEVITSTGKSIYIPIAPLWISHGPEFAEQIYEHLKFYLSKFRNSRCSQVAPFLIYVSERPRQWPVKTFKNPTMIKKLFQEYMVHFFKNVVAKELDIRNATKSYGAFIEIIEESLITPGLFAKPFLGNLPRPKIQEVPGAETNQAKNKNGDIVKIKLITEIPINITDSEAIELLFKQIKNDDSILYRWATKRCAISRKAQLHRDYLALYGIPEVRPYHTLTRPENINIPNICAALKYRGLSYLQVDFAKRFGKKITRAWLSSHLALPTANDLYPFQVLLVHSYPCITESFLHKFELYDKNGELSGFLKTDDGYQLIGFKDRKGGKNSQIKIDLKPKHAVLVKQIIELTQPLRDTLRADENDDWRYLFLICSRGFTYPSVMKPTIWNNETIASRYQHLPSEFSEYIPEKQDKIIEFISRISLTALRATRAVLLYLENRNEEYTAVALGHKKYSPELLSSYLPEPILAFFQSRWVRIFQRGIICLAMKDSPYIMRATNFESIEELHDFLKNHGLKDLPEGIVNPEYINSSTLNSAQNESADKVIFSVDIGILTALLSLNEAVLKSTRVDQLCSKAVYWSKLTQLLTKDIMDGYDNDLQDYLTIAQSKADASVMERIIYATATDAVIS